MSTNNKPRYKLGLDQFGNKWRIKGDHPRKELIEATGHSHVSKMYMD
jgi:hypothetical protein